MDPKLLLEKSEGSVETGHISLDRVYDMHTFLRAHFLRQGSFLFIELETAVEKRNLYELRQLINLVKSKTLHRHVQMKDLYRKAIDVMESLQKREDILRKLRALNIPKVITELKGYNQVPDDRVEKIMKATFILLGVNERELKVW